jgi:hypothetical protein
MEANIELSIGVSRCIEKKRAKFDPFSSYSECLPVTASYDAV